MKINENVFKNLNNFYLNRIPDVHTVAFVVSYHNLNSLLLQFTSTVND
jgi:hypothetical protein